MIDVAQKAGVSQATVSRVVNNASSVTKEMAQKVARAMNELGYKPRKKFKKTADSDNGILVLIFLDDSMNSHPAMALAKLKGVETAASRAGLTLAVTSIQKKNTLPGTLLRPDLQGVLLWGAAISPELMQQVESIPHIWLSSHTTENQNAVLTGNEQAGRLAADYLLDLGLRRIAALYLPSSEPQYKLRINGFQYACQLRSKECRTITATGGNCDSAQNKQQIARQLIKQLVSMTPRPDGLFIPDDIQTAMFYPLLAEEGIQPEKDIRIISCDNESTYLNTLHPRPATIDLCPEATGRLAVEQLLHTFNAQHEPNQVSVLINPYLVPASSETYGPLNRMKQPLTASLIP